MASEIRVNKIANRAGLSTVEYTDTGIIVSGIVTCTEISGLNALNIAGVSTFASPLDINGDIDVDGHTNLDNVNISGMTTTTGNLFLDGGKINVGTGVTIESTTGASATGQATFTGIVTATTFSGSGANLTALNASNISSGTVPTARLGSGTASSSKFLRGDSTFQNISTLFVNLNHGQNFLDDQNLIFGDASDMILIHQSSGAKSRLRNTNDSGSLDIESTLTRFLNKDGSTEKLRIDSSGR